MESPACRTRSRTYCSIREFFDEHCVLMGKEGVCMESGIRIFSSLTSTLLVLFASSISYLYALSAPSVSCARRCGDLANHHRQNKIIAVSPYITDPCRAYLLYFSSFSLLFSGSIEFRTPSSVLLTASLAPIIGLRTAIGTARMTFLTGPYHDRDAFS